LRLPALEIACDVRACVFAGSGNGARLVDGSPDSLRKRWQNQGASLGFLGIRIDWE